MKDDLYLKARAQRHRRAEKGLPAYRTWDEKIRENPNSRKIAIGAKCWDCVAGDYHKHGIAEIRKCPITECALYKFRPYK